MKQPTSNQEPRCSTCRFRFEKKNIAQATMQIECWRYPPHVMITGQAQGGFVTTTYYPTPDPRYACGEYQFGLIGFGIVEYPGDPKPTSLLS